MARRRSDAVASFTDLYQRMVGDRPLVSGLLTGHLAVEFLLRRLVSRYDVRLGEHADSLRHHALILLNHQIGTIDEAQRDVLLAINALRNRLAHQISYEPTLDDLRGLWRRASKAFSDLTDGISQGIEALDAAADLRAVEGWVLSQLFVQISYDLHEEYVSRGGNQDDF